MTFVLVFCVIITALATGTLVCVYWVHTCDRIRRDAAYTQRLLREAITFQSIAKMFEEN
jgi:hypothetical protein